MKKIQHVIQIRKVFEEKLLHLKSLVEKKFNLCNQGDTSLKNLVNTITKDVATILSVSHGQDLTAFITTCGIALQHVEDIIPLMNIANIFL